MEISEQAIKNVEGFDFREKTFAGLYDFFESLSDFRQQTQIYKNQYKKLNDYLFVNIIEKDNKEYPAALMEIYMEEKGSGCWYKKDLMVSPFSCHLVASDSYSEPNDVFAEHVPDEALTTAFRRYMIANYGKKYTKKCLEYITTSSQLEKARLQEAYKARLQFIQNKNKRELSALDIENISEIVK